MTAKRAIAALEARGWSRLATGDWSWVLVSPDGDRAARVSPWDDAYRLHAELCRRTQNPYLQRVDAILPLGPLGHVVLMERLWPAAESGAAAFCAALAVPGDSDWSPPPGVDTSAYAGDEALHALRRELTTMAAVGAASLPFWGGFDVRPGNVMADSGGGLKLIDPVFVSGPKIIAALTAGDRAVLARLPTGAVAAFLTIPVFQDGANDLRRAARDLGLLERDSINRNHSRR
jgi:hypothetical protein